MKHDNRVVLAGVLQHIVVVFLVLLLLPGAVSVYAQATPQAVIEPGAVTVTEGSFVAVNVAVKNGDNLNAFDVKVAYDAEIMTLESWHYGGYLSNLAEVKKTIEIGSFSLAAEQLATPGVSGAGTLLTLGFRTKAVGSSLVYLEQLILIQSSGEKVQPELFHGEVNSSQLQMPIPTATLVPFATWTATSTRVPTHVGIPTITPIYARVITRTATPVLPIPLLSLENGDEGLAAASQAADFLPGSLLPSTPIAAVQPDTMITEFSELHNDMTFTPGSQIEQTASANSRKEYKRQNGMIWSVGLLILAGLTGLVTLFLNLWKRL